MEKILKTVTSKVDDKEDLVVDDGAEDAVEVKELEKLIEDKHSNFSKISRHYKLFDFVSRSDPDQILRYIKHRSPSLEPLWLSDKNQPVSIPACPLCGTHRLFEFQIMPQIFDQLKELVLVDWNTIAVYTCSNAQCYPDGSEGYILEHAYIQFAEDFSRVQYGDQEQIKKQKKAKEEETKVEAGKEQEEEKGEEKKKKKKNKKKSKKEPKEGDEDPSKKKEQIEQ